MESVGEDVIIEISPNEFKAIVHVTKSTLRALSIGNEAVKKSIQEETKTAIKCLEVKSEGIEKSILEIKGTTHLNVYSARKRIEESVSAHDHSKQKPNRPKLTHFTCVKITNSSLIENYMKLRENIVKNEAVENFPEGVFMRPEKVHITFGVMSLIDENDRIRAIQLLNDCLEKIVKPIKESYGKIEINVTGLDVMQGNPSSARVVYAKIESEALQKIADGIAKAFIDAGLAKQKAGRDMVKLHMTVINVRYATYKCGPLDASVLLKCYGDFEFGSEEVNQIHLVAMQCKDEGGFYKRISTITF